MFRLDQILVLSMHVDVETLLFEWFPNGIKFQFPNRIHAKTDWAVIFKMQQQMQRVHAQ